MSRRYINIHLFCILILLSGASYGDTNVLTNPGFESGTTGWSARGGGVTISAVTSPTPHGGTYCARAYNRTDTWQGIQQNVLDKMVIGETYQISGWVRTSSSSSSTLHITFQKTDGDGTNYHWAASGTANNSGWVQLSGNYTLTVNGTLTGLLVYFEGPPSGVDIFVDDAIVYGPEPGSTEPNATGQINVNTRHQMIEGFGASGAWYEQSVLNYSEPTRTALYNTMFCELGLDIYRVRNTYDIDNGYITRSATIIQAASTSLGHPIRVMNSSWSPPAYLKSNGSTVRGTLAKDANGHYRYADFAQWWADSLTVWSSAGVNTYYVNMQNEPDWEDDWDTCRWEPIEDTNYAGYKQGFEALYANLNSLPNRPKLLAPEGANVSGAGSYINALDSTDKSNVYGYSHHPYDGSAGEPDGLISAMATFKSAYGDRPLLQTEFAKGDPVTLTWTDAMNLAILMHNFLTVEEVSAYLYWELFWASPKGLVSLTTPNYTINPVYYAFKHYSKFTDPNWQRVDASTDSSDLRISAYVSPDDQQLSVVIINTSTDTGIETDLSFTGFSIANGNIYRSSQTENCILVGGFDGTSSLNMPAYSIVTLSLSSDGNDVTAPNPPTNLEATAGNGTASLNWDDNSEGDLDGYNLYRSITPDSNYIQLNSSLLIDSNYFDNSVTNFITYYYVVTAVDTNNNESSYSDEESAWPSDGSIVQFSCDADFEAGFGDWINVTGEDSHDWLRNSGVTPSGYFGITGPDSGANGSTWYVYFETSSGYANSAGDTAYLEGPEINGSNRELTFYYHMYGADIGTLNVDVFDTSWNNGIWSRSGAQHYSISEEYTQATVDLSAYTGPIKIRFRAVAAGGYRGDIAIDDIKVTGTRLYGDFTGDDVVDYNDLPDFFGYWLLYDCNDPNDLDINDDCIINFYEFSILSKNWLIE